MSRTRHILFFCTFSLLSHYWSIRCKWYVRRPNESVSRERESECLFVLRVEDETSLSHQWQCYCCQSVLNMRLTYRCINILRSFLGYLRLFREGCAPMASPDPLSVTSDESCNTPDLEILWFRSDDAAIIVFYVCCFLLLLVIGYLRLTVFSLVKCSSNLWCLTWTSTIRACVCRVWLLSLHYQIMSPVRWQRR